jgi:hypothetical protein
LLYQVIVLGAWAVRGQHKRVKVEDFESRCEERIQIQFLFRHLPKTPETAEAADVERSQFGLEVKTDVAVITNPPFSHFDGHRSGIEEAMATIAFRSRHQGEDNVQ